MCCMNNRREKWVISLVLVGVFFSLGVAVPMILISFPGNECLLFVRWVSRSHIREVRHSGKMPLKQ